MVRGSPTPSSELKLKLLGLLIVLVLRQTLRRLRRPAHREMEHAIRLRGPIRKLLHPLHPRRERRPRDERALERQPRQRQVRPAPHRVVGDDAAAAARRVLVEDEEILVLELLVAGEVALDEVVDGVDVLAAEGVAVHDAVRRHDRLGRRLQHRHYDGVDKGEGAAGVRDPLLLVGAGDEAVEKLADGCWSAGVGLRGCLGMYLLREVGGAKDADVGRDLAARIPFLRALSEVAQAALGRAEITERRSDGGDTMPSVLC